MVIGFDDFRDLTRKLSILTGRPPLVYGKKPDSQDKLDYILKVYHEDFRQYDHRDIEAAFKDQELQEEIVRFGFNGPTLRKYIRMHKNKRTGEEKKKEKYGVIQEEIKPIPDECEKALAEIGISVGSIIREKLRVRKGRGGN